MKNAGEVGFYRCALNSPLPVKTSQAIEREIVYAPDINAAWFSVNLPPAEIRERLGKLTPKLYQAFHSGEAP